MLISNIILVFIRTKNFLMKVCQKPLKNLDKHLWRPVFLGLCWLASVFFSIFLYHFVAPEKLHRTRPKLTWLAEQKLSFDHAVLVSNTHDQHISKQHSLCETISIVIFLELFYTILQRLKSSIKSYKTSLMKYCTYSAKERNTVTP